MFSIILSMSILLLFQNYLLNMLTIIFIWLLALNMIPKSSVDLSYLNLFGGMDTVSFMLIFLSIVLMLMFLIVQMKPMKHFLMVILLMFCIFSFLSLKMLWFFVFFELSLIPIFLMILGWGYQPERFFASKMMLFYTLVGSLPFLVMISFLWTKNSEWFFFTIVHPSQKSQFHSLFSMMITMALLIKFPIFLMHLWLPQAHVEAPTEGSMVLASILLKLGSYGFWRVMTFIQMANSYFLLMILSVSMCGMVFAAKICVQQLDMKVIIAYSSVSHMTITVAGMLMESSMSFKSSLLIFLAHGITSSIMFFLAGQFYQMTGSRNILINKGFLTLSPYLVAFWFMACLFNMSGPPTPNLVGEIFISISLMIKHPMFLISLSLFLFLGVLFNLNIYTISVQSMPLKSQKITPFNVNSQLISYLHFIMGFSLIMVLFLL